MKKDARKLFAVKLIHTLVWLIFVIAIFYVVYAGIADRITWLVLFCIGLVLAEGILIMINKGKCPLTSIAYRYTDNHLIGFDIFLPKWLAKYNKIIFSIIFLIGLILISWRKVSGE